VSEFIRHDAEDRADQICDSPWRSPSSSPSSHNSRAPACVATSLPPVVTTMLGSARITPHFGSALLVWFLLAQSTVSLGTRAFPIQCGRSEGLLTVGRHGVVAGSEEDARVGFDPASSQSFTPVGSCGGHRLGAPPGPPRGESRSPKRGGRPEQPWAGRRGTHIPSRMPCRVLHTPRSSGPSAPMPTLCSASPTIEAPMTC
jgi:hypothetical protein